jgi:hypothetical protein
MEGDIQGSLDRVCNQLKVLGRIEEHLAVIAASLERLSGAVAPSEYGNRDRPARVVIQSV